MATLGVISKFGGKPTVLSTTLSLPKDFVLHDGEILSYRDTITYLLSPERKGATHFTYGRAQASIEYANSGLAYIVIESTSIDDLFKARDIALIHAGSKVFTAVSPESSNLPSLLAILEADARRLAAAGKELIRKIGMELTLLSK